MSSPCTTACPPCPPGPNRTLAVLSAMFKLAEARDLAPPGCNPCRGVRRYRETPRERFLSRAEYHRLGRVAGRAERDGSENPAAIAALRLLMLTGCRRNEILTLQWDDVDRAVGELRLPDTKTGPRMAAAPSPARGRGRPIDRPAQPRPACGRLRRDAPPLGAGRLASG